MREYLEEVKAMEQSGYFIELYTRDERLKRDARIEGREEGREEGIVQGEQRKQIEIAKRMLLKGSQPESIHELIPELSLEEISNLYEELNIKKI